MHIGKVCVEITDVGAVAVVKQRLSTPVPLALLGEGVGDDKEAWLRAERIAAPRLNRVQCVSDLGEVGVGHDVRTQCWIHKINRDDVRV